MQQVFGCCSQQPVTTNDAVEVPTELNAGGDAQRDYHDGTFVGQLAGTMRNGYGTMEYKNGDKYQGEW